MDKDCECRKFFMNLKYLKADITCNSCGYVFKYDPKDYEFHLIIEGGCYSPKLGCIKYETIYDSRAK